MPVYGTLSLFLSSIKKERIGEPENLWLSWILFTPFKQTVILHIGYFAENTSIVW
jgi:hypothetical protein